MWYKWRNYYVRMSKRYHIRNERFFALAALGGWYCACHRHRHAKANEAKRVSGCGSGFPLVLLSTVHFFDASTALLYCTHPTRSTQQARTSVKTSRGPGMTQLI